MTSDHPMARLVVLIIACVPAELRAQDAPVTLKGHAGDVHAVAFSPDGKTLASAGADVIKLWDVETGKERGALKGHRGDRGGVRP